MHDSSPLSLLSDEGGSVIIGWLADDVFYARFSKGLSADLGAAFATHLQEQISGKSGVRYFHDCGALTHYDLMARSAFARAVLANRRAFESLLILTWAEGVGNTARAFARTLGDPVELLDDTNEFERRLYQAAPAARALLALRPDAQLSPAGFNPSKRI